MSLGTVCIAPVFYYLAEKVYQGLLTCKKKQDGKFVRVLPANVRIFKLQENHLKTAITEVLDAPQHKKELAKVFGRNTTFSIDFEFFFASSEMSEIIISF